MSVILIDTSLSLPTANENGFGSPIRSSEGIEITWIVLCGVFVNDSKIKYAPSFGLS